jgi:hypothetical protein
MSDQQQETDNPPGINDDPRKLRKSDQLPEEQPAEVADDDDDADDDGSDD